MRRLRLHTALALTSLTTLAYELALMRLFSVTLWYYFAFFVISLALLGGGTAAAILFVRRSWAAERLAIILPTAALLQGITCALSPAIYLKSHLVVFGGGAAILSFGLILVLFFLPFLLGGTVVAALLSFFPDRVGSLYWADLGGASLGCVLIVPLLWHVPAPEILAWIGLLPVTAALLLRRELGPPGVSKGLLAGGAACLLLASSTLTPWNPYRVTFSKIRDLDEGLVYTRWTPLARLSVYRSIFFVDAQRSPFGWGMSPRFPGGDLEQKWIEQDECAGTPIIRFNGDLSGLGFLDYDVTNFAYRYRAFARVLVIGAGGGRDILAAKRSGADRVTAVEINPGMVDIVNKVFGDFSGRPYSLRGVEAVVDEARNYLARQSNSWDLIQISLIDSWAASVAGAFALAENNLYTVEAFGTYFDRLAPDGVLTVSRWYTRESATETARLVNLAAEALQRRGLAPVGGHIVVVNGNHIATLLASRRAFTDDELRRIDRAAGDLEFRRIWIPGIAADDPLVARILSSPSRANVIARLPLDLSAPSDDRPFFFLNVRSILDPPPRHLPDGLGYGYWPVASIRILFFLLVGAAIAWTVVPLTLAEGGGKMLLRIVVHRPQTWLYFAGIGAGFMLVELSLLQRYVLFLGHPTYASSVVLFSMLLFAGLGSATTDVLDRRFPSARLAPVALAAIGALVAFQTWVAPGVLSSTMGWRIGPRIVLATFLIAPLGYVLGMAFPLGIRNLRRKGEVEMIPYLWGINGVFSVLGSVAAIIIAVSSGYNAGLVTGLGAYLLALVMAL